MKGVGWRSASPLRQPGLVLVIRKLKMFCANNHPVASDAQFCGVCGSKLNFGTIAEAPDKSGFPKAILISLLSALGVLCLAIAAFLVIRSPGAEAEPIVDDWIDYEYSNTAKTRGVSDNLNILDSDVIADIDTRINQLHQVHGIDFSFIVDEYRNWNSDQTPAPNQFILFVDPEKTAPLGNTVRQDYVNNFWQAGSNINLTENQQAELTELIHSGYNVPSTAYAVIQALTEMID